SFVLDFNGCSSSLRHSGTVLALGSLNQQAITRRVTIIRGDANRQVLHSKQNPYSLIKIDQPTRNGCHRFRIGRAKTTEDPCRSSVYF
ncbi:MAG: hypothetical protein ACI814_004707, partial [Mariniblastus sp.]